MAVVKASYTRNPRAIKASVRYYTHRPTITGSRGKRELFGEKDVLTKTEVYQWVNRQRPGTYFYRFVLSHDPKREDAGRDLPLESLTRQALGQFSKRRRDLAGFAAVCHTDHSAVRHVHVIAVFSRKLSVAELTALRAVATAQAVAKRQELDKTFLKIPGIPPSLPASHSVLSKQIRPGFQIPSRVNAHTRQSAASFGVIYRSSTSTASSSIAASYATLPKPVCRQCNLPAKLVRRDGDLRCTVCGYVWQTQSSKRRMGYSQQEGMELSMKGWGSV
jgi:hypothetical protein